MNNVAIDSFCEHCLWMAVFSLLSNASERTTTITRCSDCKEWMTRFEWFKRPWNDSRQVSDRYEDDWSIEWWLTRDIRCPLRRVNLKLIGTVLATFSNGKKRTREYRQLSIKVFVNQRVDARFYVVHWPLDLVEHHLNRQRRTARRSHRSKWQRSDPVYDWSPRVVGI